MKGAAHTVLAVLAYNARPMSNRDLQQWTGYHADTITRVLRDLMQMGWVTARSPNGPWSLRGGRRVPGIGSRQAASENSARASEKSGQASGKSAAESGNSGFPKESDSGLVEEEEMDNQLPLGQRDADETRRALREAGIEDPWLSRLAAMPHMTPEYVRGHVDQALAEGRSVGAAIWRMRQRWRVPRGRPQEGKPRMTRRQVVEEQIRRFIEGPDWDA
jgi:hypothetical protein